MKDFFFGLGVTILACVAVLAGTMASSATDVTSMLFLTPGIDTALVTASIAVIAFSAPAVNHAAAMFAIPDPDVFSGDAPVAGEDPDPDEDDDVESEDVPEGDGVEDEPIGDPPDNTESPD